MSEIKEMLKARGVKGGVSEVAAALGVSRPYVYSAYAEGSPMFDAMVDYTVKKARLEKVDLLYKEMLDRLPDHWSFSARLCDDFVDLAFFKDGARCAQHTHRIPADNVHVGRTTSWMLAMFNLK